MIDPGGLSMRYAALDDLLSILFLLLFVVGPLLRNLGQQANRPRPGQGKPAASPGPTPAAPKPAAPPIGGPISPTPDQELREFLESLGRRLGSPTPPRKPEPGTAAAAPATPSARGPAPLIGRPAAEPAASGPARRALRPPPRGQAPAQRPGAGAPKPGGRRRIQLPGQAAPLPVRRFEAPAPPAAPAAPIQPALPSLQASAPFESHAAATMVAPQQDAAARLGGELRALFADRQRLPALIVASEILAPPRALNPWSGPGGE